MWGALLGPTPLDGAADGVPTSGPTISRSLRIVADSLLTADEPVSTARRHPDVGGRPTTSPLATPERIPSLDGLRACSILVVLIAHLAGTHGFPTAVSTIMHNDYVDPGNLAVRVFFVISGYLITALLLAEQRRYGHISLSHFFLRRTFRIFPAYLLFLAVMAGASRIGGIELRPGDVAHALTYTMNYHADRSWYLGHMWTLSVEEQFYLVWPVLFVAVGVRRGIRAALLFVAASPFIRLGVWYLAPGSRDLIGNSFGTAGDAIAIGCLLAAYRDALWTSAWVRAAVTSRWLVPLLLLVGVAIASRTRPGLLLGITVANIAIALGVERCVRRPEGGLGRLLNARPAVFVGTLSYSLYLWQQPFLNRGSDALLASFPLNICAAVAFAMLSYYLVEQPMLRVRVQVERAWLRRRTPQVTPAPSHERRKRVLGATPIGA
jgi:peptidoglycan/LPS O-acetylase OafA/YrhL